MAGAPSHLHLDQPGVWRNLSEWTHRFHHVVNATKISPSLEDLVWAGPRIVKKLGSYIPSHDLLHGFGSRVVPETVDADVFDPSHSSVAMAAAASALNLGSPAAAEHIAGAGQDTASGHPSFSMEGAKGLGSVFSYATSKWALSCIAMAVILNRTYIFAATRRRLRLRWPVRLLIRCIPIVLFFIQARRLLQSIQCQTSPEFSEMRWGNASKSSDLMFTQSGGLLHALSSTILFGSTDQESCVSVRMVPDGSAESAQDIQGSLSLLWPLFGTFCLSQFLETISCAVQGRPVAAETGMTLFEHSLAFAEADTAISNQLGWGSFAHGEAAETGTHVGNAIAISRSLVLKRVNTPPEVLLVALLSVMSHLTSHLLGVFNLQARFRLVSTGFWGICFMGSIIWSALTFSFDDPSTQGLLRYPTVCIIGFVPHVLVLGGILICLGIYSAALVLSALSVSEAGDGANYSFQQRLSQAHGNMQANMSLSDVRLSMDMDFYTALLRTGLGAISMASEAVYLNEDRDINVKMHTWLEDDRLRELEELRMQLIGANTPDLRLDATGTAGLIPIKDGQNAATSGYARERAAQKLPKARSGERRLRDGVGAGERSGRWLMALEYIFNTGRLFFRAWVTATVRILSKVGIRPSRWLLWMMRRPKQRTEGKNSSDGNSHSSASMPSSILRREDLDIPRTDGVDVEMEFRRRNWAGTSTWALPDENDLDTKLYAWWLRGGWWGTTDTSGEYIPDESNDEDDTTSVVSFATESEADDNVWESEPDDGQRTPTQRSRTPSLEDTPCYDSALQPSELARLLNPSSPEDREEAHAIAAHLRNDGILTRSQYQMLQHRQRTAILDTGRGTAIFSGSRSTKLTPEGEAELLEQLILSRRRNARISQRGHASTSWSEGGSGLGDKGPQCVVCQSTPRTVIVWPCRCLSLCDDCRVSLAMNNFDKCVCCRREVISFSRIFVP